MIPLSITYGLPLAVVAALTASLLVLVFMGIIIETYIGIMSETEKRVSVILAVLMLIGGNVGIYYSWWYNFHGWYL